MVKSTLGRNKSKGNRHALSEEMEPDFQGCPDTSKYLVTLADVKDPETSWVRFVAGSRLVGVQGSVVYIWLVYATHCL